MCNTVTCNNQEHGAHSLIQALQVSKLVVSKLFTTEFILLVRIHASTSKAYSLQYIALQC